MGFPVGWPPRVASGRRSIRFYVTGTATADFSDNAYLFSGQAAANTFTPLPYVAPGSNTIVNLGATPTGTGQIPEDNGAPVPMIWSNSIRICNDGAADLSYSFDGINVHGVVKVADKIVVYLDRYEAGIAVKGITAFRIEAW